MNLNKSIKRFLALFLTLVLSFSLAGCSFGVITHEEPSKAFRPQIIETKIIEQTTKGVTESTTHAKTTTAKPEVTEKQTTSQAQTTAKLTTAKATTIAKKHTTKPSTTKQHSTTSTTHSQSLCTITIQCKSILDNMDMLKEGHEEYVPQDGYLLQSYTVEIADGNSVYDILKRSCEAKGIKLTARSTIYGTYVSGINNLDEFDVGNESGWMYKVNGNLPMLSCDKYEVKAGDTIEFYYTCKR